jgi:hypothetical protein
VEKIMILELKRTIMFILWWPFLCILFPVGFALCLAFEAIKAGFEIGGEALNVWGQPDDTK